MAARRMGRSLENRKSGSKQLPTILSRKRKSEEDDHSQPDIQSFFNIVPKSQNSENVNTTNSSSSSSSNTTTAAPFTSLQNRQLAPSRQPLAPLSLSSENKIVSDDSTAAVAAAGVSTPLSSLKRPTGQTPRRKQIWKKPKMRDSWSQFRSFISEPVVAGARGEAPLPELNWADRQELWDLMVKKESGMYARQRAEQMLVRHPALQPKMRAILLDWLIEVCEVYRLHRETFYLAVDFLDRFLGLATNIPKNRLQLIGVTCLFIGAKLEEIYPPKLQEFAYVTDGACTEEEILQMELVVLKSLNWGLAPMTPNAWMRMYMQILHGPRQANCHAFSLPAYSGLPFSRAMQLLDLCMLDVGSLDFTYSVLATSALYHTESEAVALLVSGYTWPDISRCVRWMSAFVLALRERSPLQPKSFHGVQPDDAHHLQTHSVDLSLLERALSRLHALATASLRDSPDPTPSSLLPTGLQDTPQEEAGDIMYPPQQQAAVLTTPSCSSVGVSQHQQQQQQLMMMSPPLDVDDGDLW